MLITAIARLHSAIERFESKKAIESGKSGVKKTVRPVSTSFYERPAIGDKPRGRSIERYDNRARFVLNAVSSIKSFELVRNWFEIEKESLVSAVQRGETKVYRNKPVPRKGNPRDKGMTRIESEEPAYQDDDKVEEQRELWRA